MPEVIHTPRKIAELSERRASKPCASFGFELIEGRPNLRDGVYFTPTDAEGCKGSPVWICSPLRIAANTRDENGGEWGRLLEWRDRDGREHRWAMPMTMLAASGDELRAELLRGGLEISTNPGDRRKLGDYIASARPDVTARAMNRTGWHGSAFVLPDRTLGDTQAEPIHYQSTSAEGVRLGTAGTLAGWRDLVAARLPGNTRAVFAVSAAFAATVNGLLGGDGGGLHLRGGSSSGKSTALRIAASVWGPPEYVRTWRATDNALESVAVLHSDLPLLLDELSELPASVAGATAYMLANGSGKGRAYRDGAARAVPRWRSLFLSTGEIALSDLIAEAGGRVKAGQEVRIADIPADPGAGLGIFDRVPEGMGPGEFAEALRDAAATHYGTAGLAFLKELVKGCAEASAMIRDAIATLAEEMIPEGASGQVRRVAQRFALVAASGELATERGLTGWSEGEAERAAVACFQSWLGARGTAGATEPAAMLAQVRRFLEQHGESRFAPWEGDQDRPTINRAGFRRRTDDGEEFFVLAEAFKSDLAAGFDHRAVARALIAAGALKPDTDGGSTRPERLPGMGHVRCYRITPAIWSARNA